MEYTHDFATQAPFPHDFGLSTEEQQQQQQQQQMFQDFEQQQQQHQFTDLQDPNSAMYAINGSTPGQRASCGDVKPRLTKEQHDILEAHYQKQQKPNTSTKRGFAESLNVSLEKVNNWFQNRRAKSKQDAKKQQGTVGVFTDFGLGASDSETSPAFASADYQQMMQHLGEDEPTEPRIFEGAQPTQPYDVPRTHDSHLTNVSLLQAMANDLMLNPQDLNRRTLTQEQFDALSQQEIMLNSGDLAMLSQDPEMLNRLLANYATTNQAVGAQHEHVTLSLPSEPVIAVPTATNPALLGHPVARMEEQVGSTSSSDWTGGSRSSSVSLPRSVDLSTSYSSQQSLGQWQPGQSIPVDMQQLNEEFQKAAQARQDHGHFSETPMEQQMVWPMDDVHRRNSSASLVQSMGNVGLQTPLQTQMPTFVSPTPVSSLAARRQKQRPAPLSLRSQSYSGTNPASSPSHMQPPSISTTPQLRRIKSSNMVNGISSGRVQKNIAMPQRSPLSWTFNDALTSPQAIRHPAPLSAALAPPTPRSPPEHTVADQGQFQQFQQQQWQSASGHVLQQDTISETDAEHTIFLPASASAPNFSSPPHTPMFHTQPQHFMPPQIIPGAIIMENTPPQSAPASQQYFSQSVFGPQQPQTHYFQQPQQMVQYPVQQHMPQQMMHHAVQPQPMQQYFVTQAPSQAVPAMDQPQFINVIPQEEQMHMPATSTPSGLQFTITTSGPLAEMPMQFAQHGVPIVDAQGQIQMAMPSQLQFVQQKPLKAEHQAPKVQPKYSPGGTQLVFASNPADHSPLQPTSQIPKHASSTSDFFVHEYTPPQDMKRSVTPRKAADSGPKNYTFANQTSKHFEKAAKKADAKLSNSNSPEAISA